MHHRFTREELYDLVWAEPVQRVAAKLGISGVGLKKVCRGASVPVPERGYWAKLEAGKRVVKPVLPIRPIGMLEEVEIGQEPWPPRVEDELTADPPTPPEFAEPVPEMIERVRKLVGQVTCVRNLDRPHPAVAKLLNDDEKRRQKQLASSYPMSWDNPVFDSPFERRRLRILSSVFLALARCGARPHVRGRDGRDMGAVVGSVPVGFRLDSPKECERDDGRDSYRNPDARQSAGPLRFRIEGWWTRPGTDQRWDDTDDEKLEGTLTEIVVQVLASGEITLREWAQDRYKEKIERRKELHEEVRRKKEEEERKERERIEKIEQDHIDELLKAVGSWRQAVEIRAYVQAVREANVERTSDEAREKLDGWTAWALGAADKMDPLVRK